MDRAQADHSKKARLCHRRSLRLFTGCLRESGPCLSPNVAVQPLSPATDRRLGRPLPHQLSNRTRAHLSAIKSLITEPCGSAMSCGISDRFQSLSPSDRQVAHVLLTRPPLSLQASIRKLPPVISVRLACVRRAASVRPELGSNS